MTIYNFNLGIGWASSGVEYAQAYRANIFRKNKQKAKFIFTDMFFENIQGMTSNIGFKDEEVIWLYQYYTDIKIRPTTYTIQELESHFSESPSSVDKNNNLWIYNFSRINTQINVFLSKDGKFVSKTEKIINGKLVQRDYYNYVKMFSEYFKPVNKQANLYQRRFFNENGSMAYEELLNGKQSLYLFKNKTIYSLEALISDFIKQLELSNKDIVIIDRSTIIGPEILREKGGAKVGVVIHADHYSELETNDNYILWNNYYDYQFQNAKSIDFFVTATDLQKKILEYQFKKYQKGKIKIFTISVGSLEKLRDFERQRKANSLITASRLATEKHIDWIIEAVVKAKPFITDLTLDIYGEGGEKNVLEKLVEKRGAKEYIHFMGQRNLQEVYKEYTTYISGSTSEGFGLTLMEAVGSGLGMIGFDVRYGNPTFIDNGKNGFLVNYEKNKNSENIDQLYQGIRKTFKRNNNKLEKNFKNKSYDIAKLYLTDRIKKDWKNLEKEVLND